MIFEENEISETLKVYGNVFIYFLLNKNDVVYVGQTKKGIVRPLSHRYDKIFDTIKFIYCEENELDYLEDKYILKYKPKYNKTVNIISNYSLQRTRDKIRKLCNNNNITIRTIKKLLIDIDVKPFEFNGILYIKNEEFEKLFIHIKKERVYINE